jgi:hypothetical protein
MSRTARTKIVHPTGGAKSAPTKKAGGGKGNLLAQADSKQQKNPNPVKTKPTPAKQAAKKAAAAAAPGSKRHAHKKTAVDPVLQLISKAGAKRALVKYSAPSNTASAVTYLREYVVPAIWKFTLRHLDVVAAHDRSAGSAGKTITLLPRHTRRGVQLASGFTFAGEPKPKRTRHQHKGPALDAVNSAISQVLEAGKKKVAARQQSTASKQSKSPAAEDEEQSQEEAQPDQDDTAQPDQDQEEDQEEDQEAAPAGEGEEMEE